MIKITEYEPEVSKRQVETWQCVPKLFTGHRTVFLSFCVEKSGTVGRALDWDRMVASLRLASLPVVSLEDRKSSRHD